MRLPLWFFLLVIGLFFITPLSAQACTCASGAVPCQSFWTTDAVFSAEVKEISEIPLNREIMGRKYDFRQKLVRLNVTEAFRGVSDKTVELTTGMGGGDCGFEFEVGQSYLVYAYKNPETGKLGTGICTRTRLLSKAAEDLEYFRGLASAKSGSTIYGKVLRRYTRKQDEPYRQPTAMANIPVTLKRVADGTSIETKTDVGGDYRLTDLMPGEYKVRVQAPTGMWDGYLLPDGGAKINVYDKGCGAAYFWIETNTQLSGRVLTEDSQPAADMSVQLVPIDQINARSQNDMQMMHTDKDGRFSFRSIPSGTYYLGVRLFRIAEPTFPYPRTFYPGTTDLETAKIITIKEGEVVENFDFKLPQKLSLRKVEGIVVYPDGSPAPNAMIGVEETEYAEGSMGYALTQSKADGSFSLTLLDGLRYKLKPVVSATDTPSHQRHAEPIEIPAKGDVTNIKFVITEPNGNCDKCMRWTRKSN